MAPIMFNYLAIANSNGTVANKTIANRVTFDQLGLDSRYFQIRLASYGVHDTTLMS